jgi:hypothetical protein
MSDEPQPGVIGSLPRTRPHRRSDKRAAPRSATAPAEPARPAATPQPPKPKPAARTKPTAKPTAAAKRPKEAATKAAPPKPTAARRPVAAPAERPARELSPGVLETAVQAAAELAEIGLHASARALRRAVSRLPRP